MVATGDQHRWQKGVDMRRTTGALVGLLMIVATAACSSETPEENTQEACSAAEQLTVALDNFDMTLSPGATVDEVRDARDSVRQAWQELDAAADEVAEDRGEALDEAWEDFEQSVDDVDGDATVRDAAESLRDDAVEVQEARDALADELGC
jgi:ATPase subunit of ABC transporter with duplicated ATPase domains